VEIVAFGPRKYIYQRVATNFGLHEKSRFLRVTWPIGQTGKGLSCGSEFFLKKLKQNVRRVLTYRPQECPKTHERVCGRMRFFVKFEFITY
jgi:hypothetical protein